MAKKFLFIIILLCSCSFINAQTMSDEQVMEYILNERDKGSDEKTIAQNLLNKGVSPAQLRKIQKKYYQENL